MAKDLCDNFKLARELFEEASDATSLRLKKLCFDGPESELQLTENTQPALLVASVAAFRVAEAELGFTPAAVAGHSLGEYSALVAAGAFPLATAARWVRERGRAMQAAVPAGQGGMAAIMGMEDAQVDALCAAAVKSAETKRSGGAGLVGETEVTVECVLSPANYNAPGQTVIAGAADAVAEAVALIKAGEFSGKAIPLAVSAPFHCALMAPARERMAELFAAANSDETPRTLRFPYVPNRTARLTQEASVVFELLVDQVDHTVQWRQSVAMLIERGYTQACEFGPGKVLQGLAKRIAGGIPGANFSSIGVSDMASLAGLKTIYS
jgi:[acyl-carrier-protein] S-malonyltransferase